MFPNRTLITNEPSACADVSRNKDSSSSGFPMSSSSSARVLSNSSLRSSRWPSNRKYRANQSHNQKDSLVSGNRRREPKNTVPVRRSQARNESQDGPGNLPIRYLRELPRCEAENQISATTTDGDKLPAVATPVVSMTHLWIPHVVHRYQMEIQLVSAVTSIPRI